MRRLLAVAGTAGLAAGGIALVLAEDGSSSRPAQKPRLAERRVESHRASARHRPVVRHRSAISRYGVDIQAVYARYGNPLLVGNFSPDGGLAKPHWTVCPPPVGLICRPLKTSRLLIPGPTPPGTVFRVSATFHGRMYEAASAIWTGAVAATRRPWLEGQALAGARVSPRGASWRGGWKAVPGDRRPLGLDSGGRGRSFDSLSVEACRTASGQHCVNLTPQGQGLDFAQEPVTVPQRFIGWYLFAFDERFGPDAGFAAPAYATFAIPALKVGATVARSGPLGPVRS